MNPHTAFRFVIVGGGTAGWMAALLLARQLPAMLVASVATQPPPRLQISVLDAPEIGIIGVGEGSTPSLKRFFNELSIAEHQWMPACQATYKSSIRFCHWTEHNGKADEYSHPFLTQLDVHSEQAFYSNCFKRRLGLAVATSPDQFLFNAYLAAAQLAPVTPAHFPFRLDYGYHFDASLLGQFLKQQALSLGVEYQHFQVGQVQQWPDGSIRSLTSLTGQLVEADFFIDCSGFRSLLLQQTLQVPFCSFADNLFNDAAVVLPGPALSQLPTQTTATALRHGWTWQIPLQNRTGYGYVYSSAFCTPDAAETELRQHLRLPEQVTARHLQMRVGQVARHWEKNCLALGLAQGFIEPLEATALHLVQTSLESFLCAFVAGRYWLQRQWAVPAQGQQQFNAQVSQRFERVRDYIVAHYKLNNRQDSAYWQANRANPRLSESLLQLLDVWYRGADLAQEISRQQLDCHFGTTSWHCLLAGYRQFPPCRVPQPAGVRDALVDLQIAELFRGCQLNFQPQQRDSAKAPATVSATVPVGLKTPVQAASPVAVNVPVGASAAVLL